MKARVAWSHARYKEFQRLRHWSTEGTGTACGGAYRLGGADK